MPMTSVLVSLFLSFEAVFGRAAHCSLRYSPAAPASGGESVATATVAARDGGPVALGAAVAILDRLASGARDCQTGNRHRLASPRLALVLDMEEPPARRPAACSGRRPRIDSDHVAAPPPLGRSADSWR